MITSKVFFRSSYGVEVLVLSAHLRKISPLTSNILSIFRKMRDVNSRNRVPFCSPVVSGEFRILYIRWKIFWWLSYLSLHLSKLWSRTLSLKSIQILNSVGFRIKIALAMEEADKWKRDGQMMFSLLHSSSNRYKFKSSPDWDRSRYENWNGVREKSLHVFFP